MRLVLGCVLAVSVPGAAPGSEPLDDLFAGWAAAQSRAESFVVEFSVETKFFEERQKATGTFRLVRTKTGELFASSEVVAEEPKGEKADRFSGLLNGSSVYLLNHDKKTAVRFKVGDGELMPFLEKYFNPFVVL